MSKTILIMGESGSGKTTSMRKLNPKETFYIDCDRKGLSWKGWKNDFNKENKNYLQTSDVKLINSALQKIDKEQTQIKTVVIDTLNAIMIDDEFRRMREKNYDKWMDLAYAVYDLCTTASTYRDDLTVIFTGHSQTERDETGFLFTRLKTSGSKLGKIVLESKFTTVILAKVLDGKNLFEVHAKDSTVKTPLGAFEVDTIENDITKVLEALKEY